MKFIRTEREKISPPNSFFVSQSVGFKYIFVAEADGWTDRPTEFSLVVVKKKSCAGEKKIVAFFISAVWSLEL